MKCPVCKKNIPEESVKCPYCKTRTGLLCSHCNTVNSVRSRVCKNCGQELLKICPHCKSVNFPSSNKCRKCGSPFVPKVKKSQDKSAEESTGLEFSPKFYTREQASSILTNGLLSEDKKIFSVVGVKGIGKTYLLKKVRKNLEKENFHWCTGKCTPLTQLTPGGVIQDMLLNLFKLPNYCINNDELHRDASKFFANEFKFLDSKEITVFLNFLYNFQDGNYEDIIINKHKTYDILMKIFEALIRTGKFIIVIDNLDFIDGFSIEFLTNLIEREQVWKSLKLIAVYNEYRPVNSIFYREVKNLKVYTDINLTAMSLPELENCVKATGAAGKYLTPREKDVIFAKSGGNPAVVEQAVSYSFDCQISDRAFIMPKDFSTLIKERLEILKKNNNQAYKVLCGAAILGDRLNLVLLKDIFGLKPSDFDNLISYLAKSNFIRQYNDMYYEFNNLLLWETVLKNLTKDSIFEDINVKIGKAVSMFNMNTNATMAMIAHNLKENRMAFDIWTKITRLASFVGDINLYVIAQKQCLALINEFNENETLNIRYNISERLGKLLTEYDAEEALEYLPDAINKAKENNNEEKEIELLGYLALCCKKTGNYFGDVECVNNVLKKLQPAQELECAMIKTTKLHSLLSIGNCGEVVNLVDNDILPVLSNFLDKPRLDKTIPMGFIYDTWLRTHLILATALCLQGNDRVFEVLTFIFETIEKHRLKDKLFVCKTKLVLAYANTMKGDINTSEEILKEISYFLETNVFDSETVSLKNLVCVINKFIRKDYDGLQDILFEAVTFANNIGDNFTKNILKVLLGKVFKDRQQAKRAIEIYNEQVTYFAKEKMALGALLSWYLIAEAQLITENPKSSIEVASQAIEIAQAPHINNTFFIILLKTILAKAYMDISDYQTAKINIESALILAKKYSMNDLLSKIYFLYGQYYQELGTTQSASQSEYLKGSLVMYGKALELIVEKTKNTYLKNTIEEKKKLLKSYCELNGFNL